MEEDVAAVVTALGDVMLAVRDDDAAVSGPMRLVVWWEEALNCGIAVSVPEFPEFHRIPPK
jgi:hypothetical protein